MGSEITTSTNALGGIKTEKAPELTKEEKATQKESDETAIRSYELLIEQTELEIDKLEKAVKANIPNREVLELIDKHKAEIAKAKKFKEIVQGRQK